MRILLALVLLLPGCAVYSPRNIDDAVKIVREAGGSGCLYVRGNTRPHADWSVLAVSTYGTGTNYQDCLQAVPAEARAMIGQ